MTTTTPTTATKIRNWIGQNLGNPLHGRNRDGDQVININVRHLISAIACLIIGLAITFGLKSLLTDVLGAGGFFIKDLLECFKRP